MLQYVATSEEAVRAALDPKGSGAELVTNVVRSEPSVLKMLSRVTALATDFDGTLTAQFSHWYFLERNNLPKDILEERLRQRDENHLRAPGMNEAELLVHEENGVRNNFEVYSQFGFTKRHFLEAGLSCPVREGASEFIRRFKKSMVVSHGLEPCIRAFVDHHRIGVDHICAGKVEFGERCTVDVAGVTGNKGERVKKFIREHDLKPEDVLRMGDSWGDRHLFDPQAPNVMLLPPSEPEEPIRKSRADAIRRLWGTIPLIILASDNFYPLIKLMASAQRPNE